MQNGGGEGEDEDALGQTDLPNEPTGAQLEAAEQYYSWLLADMQSTVAAYESSRQSEHTRVLLFLALQAAAAAATLGLSKYSERRIGCGAGMAASLYWFGALIRDHFSAALRINHGSDTERRINRVLEKLAQGKYVSGQHDGLLGVLKDSWSFRSLFWECFRRLWQCLKGAATWCRNPTCGCSCQSMKRLLVFIDEHFHFGVPLGAFIFWSVILSMFGGSEKEPTYRVALVGNGTVS